jgi:3'-5' exoribonuclease
MKSPYVNEVEPNRVITTSFLVHSKEIRQKKSGEMYLSLLLGDKTGELDSKMWDNVAEVIDTFDRDDFVKVKGLIQIFHNRPQLTIHKMRRMEAHEVDFGDYFPCSERDPTEMWAELRAIAGGMRNPHLKGLVESLLDDPEIAERYRRAPAAKQIHHAWLAHDIGKIYELNYERGFSYSNDGQLLGHIAIALRMVGDKIRALPDFPPALRALVEHMILSHHGQLEFGSPKVPLFPEALLLHYIDDMDSKMECMRALIERDRQIEGCFTTYSSALTRTALKKEKYLNGAMEPPPAPAASLAANGVTPLARPEPRPPEQIQLPTLEPAFAAHPLFAPRTASPFADKLKQALDPARAEPKQEG